MLTTACVKIDLTYIILIISLICSNPVIVSWLINKSNLEHFVKVKCQNNMNQLSDKIAAFDSFFLTIFRNQK